LRCFWHYRVPLKTVRPQEALPAAVLRVAVLRAVDAVAADVVVVALGVVAEPLRLQPVPWRGLPMVIPTSVDFGTCQSVPELPGLKLWFTVRPPRLPVALAVDVVVAAAAVPQEAVALQAETALLRQPAEPVVRAVLVVVLPVAVVAAEQPAPAVPAAELPEAAVDVVPRIRSSIRRMA
jgi:hypothetical protein